ncbi:MAG: YigZ family protein [Lachnospiraceae bacterium]|nr:YigZ family protein [Lachnospiraceae bacterium]
MRESYCTVTAPSRGEYEEKKSRFLGLLCPVSSEEEMQAVLAQVRKEHWEARHHCYACRLQRETVWEKASDDGEPAGTGGRPILDVIAGAGLTDVLCVVTRYFGGTLLGTGGLTRAYAAGAREALAGAQIVRRIPCIRARIETDYGDVGRVLRLCESEKIRVADSEYGAGASLTVLLPEGNDVFVRKLADATAGRAGWIPGEPDWLEEKA